MYEAYWGLTESPFSLTPDPRFLYMSRSHEDALMMLHYAITRNKGAAMLSGTIGLGKTTISRKLLELLDPVGNRVVLIVNPILTPVQILQEILDQLEIPTQSRNRQVLVTELHKALLGFYERGIKVVLMIDEAHLIRSANTFEELRLLLNCQMNDQFLVNLLLIGQDELRGKIQKVPALQQRLAVRQRLLPLDQVETGEMIYHRLKVAGYTEDHSPFTPDAIFEIHKHTGGTPRLTSQLADNALMMGFAQKAKKVDAFLMHSVSLRLSGQGGGMNLADAIRMASNGGLQVNRTHAVAGSAEILSFPAHASAELKEVKHAESPIEDEPSYALPEIAEAIDAPVSGLIRLELDLTPAQLIKVVKIATEGQRQVLTLREGASYLRLTTSKLEQLARNGKVPAFKVDGSWRFSRAKLHEWTNDFSNEQEQVS